MRDKYSSLQITLHWLVFLLVIITYGAMELRGFFPRTYRPGFNLVHYSGGVAILVLMVARLLVRIKQPAPPILPKPTPMMTGLAHLGHLALYLVFIALPVLGVALKYYKGQPWGAFGMAMPYASVAEFDFADSLKAIHETLANLGYWIIGLHTLAALIHHYYWKDNTLLRMMPKK